MEEKRERALITCEECGVEFFGRPKQRFCPMHLREHHRENLRRERERKKKPRVSQIEAINDAARKAGLSYGQYQALKSMGRL